jgi:DNA repair exonuclease SbcCD nuclease subunit
MIKIAYFSDAHGRIKSPKNRTDDYLTAFQTKFSFMIDWCLDNGVDYIINGGDIVDHHSVGYRVTNFLLRELKRWESFVGHRRFLSITGQHDVRYHSHFEDTPYESLIDSGLIYHLSENPLVLKDFRDINAPEINIYGSSFGCEIPEITNKEAYNILTIHDMIVEEKTAEWEEGCRLASTFLRSNPFNLIIAGDNHKPFKHIYRNRMLIMCGSMMRKSIDQKDYKPKFYVSCIPNNQHEEVFFPIEPDVFKEEEVAIGKERKILVEKFAEGLKDSALIGLQFSDRIKKAIEDTELEEHVVETVNEIMEVVHDRPR